MKEIYLSGGSFWDLQRYFDCVDGVADTQVGFANGNIMHPSYAEVCTGQTGFAESLKLRYDDATLPLHGILDLYFRAVGPILLKRKEELDTQHRLGIYYIDLRDTQILFACVGRVLKDYKWAVTASVEPLRNYYPAEEYHQRYHEKHPSGYCHIEREAFTYAGQYKV